MRYLKTFESFSFNENASVELPEESKVAIENKVEEEVSKLTPEQMEEAKAQLEEFAAKNGLTFEDLQDPKKVEAVLAKHAPANESWLGDKWSQFKNWIGFNNNWSKYSSRYCWRSRYAFSRNTITIRNLGWGSICYFYISLYYWCSLTRRRKKDSSKSRNWCSSRKKIIFNSSL